MRKTQVLLLVVVAVCVLSAYAASSTFAAHEWLDLEGAHLTKTVEALTDMLILIHHKPPAILGGGEITIHCTGQLHGNVGTAGKDAVGDVLGLKGELNSIDCEVSTSTNASCPAKTLVTAHAVHLPWTTQLVLNGAVIEDELFESMHHPGYNFECGRISVECTENERLKWIANSTAGAEFEFTGMSVINCTDGGPAAVLGKGTLLDFFVS
jgi:hypothetical protein